MPQERSGNLTETALEVSQNNFTPSTSVSSHARVVAQVLSTSEIPDSPIWPMKSLSVRKGNTVYDVLGYPQDDIGSLLDDILESEKLIKIECVH
ncbi:hypothetical protein N7522_006328 [Penicillium canescens]|nr:hypothetical protein N7522_006328 [Penicillium canescens]